MSHTPEDKAKELVGKFQDGLEFISMQPAITSAIIHVQEVIVIVDSYEGGEDEKKFYDKVLECLKQM